MLTIKNDKQVTIFGDHSPHGINLTPELFGKYGEGIFHVYHKLDHKNYLPYRGSESHPLTIRAFEYALENEKRGEKHWHWGEKMQGRWYYRGYYYPENGNWVFPDHNEKIKI